MRAISICAFKELPFTLNMVLTAENRNEIEEMVELAERLGSGGVRFGHLMPTPETALRKLDLTPEERREVEVRNLATQKERFDTCWHGPGLFQRVSFFSLRSVRA